MTQVQQNGCRVRIAAFLMAIVVALVLASCGVTPFAPVSAFAADPAGTGTTGAGSATDNIFSGIVNDDGSIKLADKDADDAKTLGGIVTTYRTIASAITGILAVTMFIFMLVQFSKLGAAGDNEQARKRAIAGILTTGIATALLGGATIVIGFLWNILSNVG